MKKKKKWLVALLCFGVFALIVLGNESSETQHNNGDETSETNKELNAEDDTDLKEEDAKAEDEEESSDQDVKAEDEEESSDQDAKAEDEEESSDQDVTIEEQVLVDQGGLVITAMEYTTDIIMGDGIKLLIENNSEQNLTVGCTALIVNDYMITDFFVSDVAAGKKANVTMYLSSSELNAAGIESVGQIETYFHVYDSDSYKSVFDTDIATIQTSEYANMDTTADDTGTELYNEGGIKIVGKAVDENSFWGTAILLYIENVSGKNIGIQCNNMSINGFMMTPFFSCDVYDGKKAISSILLMTSELEENEIESLEEIELQFHIYDVNTYSTVADSEPITFSAQ